MDFVDTKKKCVIRFFEYKYFRKDGTFYFWYVERKDEHIFCCDELKERVMQDAV